ncbi:MULTISPECIES: hypothetical protein [Parachlamydia]|jgi:hypothetical protein|uniref:ArnR1-like winged helix-turn-helix domain-containing protein n=2 Tax=Parachlamydia acanthamoebae TaxID=83552 RepID=F8L0C3_PARAV|nr:hypothetical protein [Parachlamydia acanthamoebae]EFB41623.1 hypothetical protein pah_c026o056 [Parachlamydia acanthamoebae str. Hall's coccus]KIA77634.1 hypothetical protein DB43_GC00070 [Parachlamydia acanthamoebae]CCB86653.1 putative uncharacterized protein [Parachlamydia acanthamoebae UV-7]
MSRAKTKDERFMIAVYEEVQDDFDREVDRYEMGNRIGLQSRGVDAICNMLIQANFLKKRSPLTVSLTENGKNLVLRVLQE